MFNTGYITEYKLIKQQNLIKQRVFLRIFRIMLMLL